MKTSNSNKALLALTTAALSLPGIAPKSAQAQAVPEKFTASYRFTEYQEEGINAAVGGSGAVQSNVDRYDISVHQFSVSGPASSNVGFNVDIITETLSGASPWYVAPSNPADLANSTPVQVISGATIDESRDEVNIGASFYRDSSRTGIGLSYSSENDYESLGANINNTLYYNGNNTTVDFGLSFSIDDITPTQAPGINRVTSEDKDSLSIFAGFSQVISKTLIVGATGSYTTYDGFLSDPYKLASVAGALLADSRPDKRQQTAIDLQLRKYLPVYATALHADYRFYSDNWGISSNTLSVAAYKNFEAFQLSGKLRFYDQSEATFYRNFYIAPRADELYSSDFRLSDYNATSFRLGVNKTYDFGTLYAAYETYSSGGGDNPGLVDFSFFTAGIDYKF